MASSCEVRLAGEHTDAAALMAAAQAEVLRIEAKYSRYRASSLLSRINAAAGSAAPVAIDTETADLLGFAAQLHVLSGGLFDITSGVLRRAWDFSAARVPHADELHALLPLIGWGRVEWTRDEVHLPRAGMELDFGGFGKEYAADRAHAVLVAGGARSGFVNLGGDIRVIGPQPDGAPWQFGIQSPRVADATPAGIALGHGALATSGDYERFFEHAGTRYCHILDPRSGWPAQGWQSVSVLAPACLAAGALSTIAMLKGNDAVAFLREQSVGYLAIDAHGAIHRHDAPPP